MRCGGNPLWILANWGGGTEPRDPAPDRLFPGCLCWHKLFRHGLAPGRCAERPKHVPIDLPRNDLHVTISKQKVHALVGGATKGIWPRIDAITRVTPVARVPPCGVIACRFTRHNRLRETVRDFRKSCRTVVAKQMRVSRIVAECKTA